jgi:hypothetical protein
LGKRPASVAHYRRKRFARRLSAVTPSRDLEAIISALHVEFLSLLQCRIAPGSVLEVRGGETIGVVYGLEGACRVVLDNATVIELDPNVLVVTPGGVLRIENPMGSVPRLRREVDLCSPSFRNPVAQQLGVGKGPSHAVMICGIFDDRFALTKRLFDSLSLPITERFSPEERIGDLILEAHEELSMQRLSDASDGNSECRSRARPCRDAS